MTVPFTHIPQNIRVPLFYAEVDNSQANSGELNQRALIIGQMLDDGSAEPNVPQICSGVGDAQIKYGLSAQLTAMFKGYRQNDTFGEVWCLPLPDDSAAIAATGQIAISRPPKARGIISLYIAGIRYQIPASPVQSVQQIAAAIIAAINADPTCPLSAASAANGLEFTAKQKGLSGNEIDLRINYLGALAAEETPLNLDITITSMSGGAVNSSFTEGLMNCGDVPFDFIVCPYSDVATLDALKEFLDDQAGRWAWNQQIYGHFFAATRGTLGAAMTLGAARNDPHGTILPFNDSPSPAYVVAAQLAGAVAPSLRNDPGRPVQTLPIIGMLAPPAKSRFVLSERNSLLYSGMSTFSVGSDGTCYAENIITTYQKNAYGNPDNSYLEIETLFTLSYVLRFMKTRITSKFARMKLADNGTRFGSGAAIVTPNILKAEVIAAYQKLEEIGYVQNSEDFVKQVIVERNAINRNRVDCMWPGTLINQLRIFALLAQFRL